MDSKLLWFFDDDVLSLRIPTDHVVILGTFEEAVRKLKIFFKKNRKR
jgi:hypothetical protein